MANRDRQSQKKNTLSLNIDKANIDQILRKATYVSKTVQEFKYIDGKIDNKNTLTTEIDERILAANRCHFVLQDT